MRSLLLGLAAMATCLTLNTGAAYAQSSEAQSQMRQSLREEADRRNKEEEREEDLDLSRVKPKGAADAKDNGKAVDPAINLAKGKTMAPAMLAGNQIPCTVTEANFLFNGKMDVAGKKVDTDFVEVACENDLGYVLARHKDNTFASYDCISTSQKDAEGKNHPLKCHLPGNTTPHEGLQAVLTKGGVPCQATKALSVSQTPALNIYEVACKDADGQLVVMPRPRTSSTAPQFFSCYTRLTAPEPCSLTPKEQTVGYILAHAAKAPSPCAATDQRFVTRATTGSRYYELACPDKTGFMVEINTAGAFVRAIPCAAATRIAEGCKLTTAAP